MRFCVLSLLLLPLAGCGVELLTTTAIQGELASQNVQQATRQLNQAKDMKADIELNQAIRAYQAEHGVNPPSLEALVPDYLAALPANANGYDPATASINPVKGAPMPGTQPPGATVPPGDLHAMLKMREAINAYGGATGFYPPTLESLVPHYLTEVPLASNGEPYIYNNQDGELIHPLRVGQPTQNYAGGGTGGYTSGYDTGVNTNSRAGASSTNAAIDARQRRNAAQFGGVSTGVGNPAGSTPNPSATKSRVTDSLNRSVSSRQ